MVWINPLIAVSIKTSLPEGYCKCMCSLCPFFLMPPGWRLHWRLGPTIAACSYILELIYLFLSNFLLNNFLVLILKSIHVCINLFLCILIFFCLYIYFLCVCVFVYFFFYLFFFFVHATERHFCLVKKLSSSLFSAAGFERLPGRIYGLTRAN